eukprot:jgi/Bigna1/133635/aug1.22_g8343
MDIADSDDEDSVFLAEEQEKVEEKEEKKFDRDQDDTVPSLSTDHLTAPSSSAPGKERTAVEFNADTLLSSGLFENSGSNNNNNNAYRILAMDDDDDDDDDDDANDEGGLIEGMHLMKLSEMKGSPGSSGTFEENKQGIESATIVSLDSSLCRGQARTSVYEFASLLPQIFRYLKGYELARFDKFLVESNRRFASLEILSEIGCSIEADLVILIPSSAHIIPDC